MATGLEVDFYKDIHQIRISLEAIAKTLRERNELEKNK